MSPQPHTYLVCRDVSGVVEYMQISDDEIGFCLLRSEGTLFSAEGATNVVNAFNLLAPPEGGRGAWRVEPAENYFPPSYQPQENAALRAALTPPAVLLDVDKALEADKLYVERQLAEADDHPWGTVRLMWQSRLAAIAQEITPPVRSGLDIPRAAQTEGGVA